MELEQVERRGRGGEEERERLAAGVLSACAICLCTTLRSPSPVPTGGPSTVTSNMAEVDPRGPGGVRAGHTAGT